jgi:hypothetical protein
MGDWDTLTPGIVRLTVIPARWKVEVRGSGFNVSLGKVSETLISKIKRAWLKWHSAYLMVAKP